ncbi:hypothetical protein Trydic_g22294 [Trypoxylus dichotomus]
MKTALLFTFILAAAFARPQFATIGRFLTDFGTNGYKYLYDTSDQQLKAEVAELKNEGREDEALSVQGFYSYIGTDGKNYSVGYTADETGFHPEGTHLPPAADVKRTPPVGIPPAALASLAGK